LIRLDGIEAVRLDVGRDDGGRKDFARSTLFSPHSHPRHRRNARKLIGRPLLAPSPQPA
jgi:hypothetical protein